jgi:hypothetical protein
MADASNPHQRNLYQKKYDTMGYRDGRGVSYSESLRKASWPVATDVPAHAQKSSIPAVEAGKYSSLHPMEYTHGHTYESSFSNAYRGFGLHVEAQSALSVTDRLFTPSKSQTRSSFKHPISQLEVGGDEAMLAGEFGKAIQCYTQAIAQRPSLFAYEKRCAAFAHVGRYQEALQDARKIEQMSPAGTSEGGPARRRVKTLEDFLQNSKSFKDGYKEGAATLVALLTPKGMRQWRSQVPATYMRSYPFGESGKMAITASNFSPRSGGFASPRGR